MEKMVELRSVSKRFGDFVAVDRVDLSIRAGEFLTLLGPSGCGKTTLLRMISGFEQPTEGAVFLAGQDVTRLPPFRRDVNQVFQSYALFPHLSVWDNVAFGLKMKRVAAGEMRRRVQQAMEMVSLAGFEQRMPHELSGGQKQRVALARALVCEPKVLLLDEPLAALDAKLRRAMQVELKRLQSRLGITFVFVTHDQEEALVMSDRIAVINRGRIEQIGTVSDVYHRPQSSFVADFLGSANLLELCVELDDGVFARLKHASGAQLSIPSQSFETGASVLACIRPEKIHVSAERVEAENMIEASVGEAIFRGATNQLQLQTTGGLELTALVACREPSAESFGAGERVFCRIDPMDVVVLNAEGSRRAVPALQS